MDVKLNLLEHLAELRKRIIICLIALGLCAAFCLPLSPLLLEFLKTPAQGYINTLAFFRPQEAFLIYMKLALLCGLVISMPIILYELWSFISPAVEDKFKNYVFSFIFSGSFIFILGVAFAYFILLPRAIKFLLSFQSDILIPVISAREYIGFVVAIILGCGIIFQMPILSFILTRAGIISPKILRKKAKWAILFIFIAAALITPTTDAFNMLIFAVPMLFLYEISIWVSKFAK